MKIDRPRVVQAHAAIGGVARQFTGDEVFAAFTLLVAELVVACVAEHERPKLLRLFDENVRANVRDITTNMKQVATRVADSDGTDTLLLPQGK